MIDMNGRVEQAMADSGVWYPKGRYGYETTEDISFWLHCVGGEVGELQNKFKKYLRGTYTDSEVMPILRDEAVDVFVYMFNLAGALGMDLEAEYDKKRAHNDERWNPAGDVGRTAPHHQRSRGTVRDDVQAEAPEGRTEVRQPDLP